MYGQGFWGSGFQEQPSWVLLLRVFHEVAFGVLARPAIIGWLDGLCFQNAQSWLLAGGLIPHHVDLSLRPLEPSQDTVPGFPRASDPRERLGHSGFYVLIPDVTHGLFHYILFTRNKSRNRGHAQGQGN